VLATGGNAPDWPRSTEKPALITLRLLVQQDSWFQQAVLGGKRVVRLELLDYPGEWLVDLPLLEQSYDAWSAETLAHLREPPRASMAEEFLNFIGTLSPDAPASEATEVHGFRLYTEALGRCRREAGLRWLQPGRFLMPGEWQDAPFMHFFPSMLSASFGTLGALLRNRFEVYKSEIRKAFFEPHFSAFNRQVVLVDVLGALFAGQAAFEDVTKALGSVGASYARLLEGGWFSGQKIERVAFAATKADHVDDLQRDNLRLTLQYMVDSGPTNAKPNVRRSFHVISSVRCTVDDNVVDNDGRVKRVVRGVKLGGTVQQPFSAGFVPAGAVQKSFWSQPFFEMPKLQPPAFQGGDTFPIEHLNLDGLLAELLGDVL
jgi:predicted YcjX-like family ATPase